MTEKTKAAEAIEALEAAQQCITDFIDVYKRGCSLLILDEAVKSLRDDALRKIKKVLEHRDAAPAVAEGE